MSWYIDKEMPGTRVWAPDHMIELGPVEVSAHLVSCDGCKRRIKRTRPLIVAGTEFTLCTACIKRVRKVTLVV